MGLYQGAGVGEFREINHPCVPWESGCAGAEYFVSQACSNQQITLNSIFLFQFTIVKNIYFGTGSSIHWCMVFFEAGLSEKFVETVSNLPLFCWSSIITANTSLSGMWFPSSSIYEYSLDLFCRSGIRQSARSFIKIILCQLGINKVAHLDFFIDGCLWKCLFIHKHKAQAQGIREN